MSVCAKTFSVLPSLCCCIGWNSCELNCMFNGCMYGTLNRTNLRRIWFNSSCANAHMDGSVRENAKACIRWNDKRFCRQQCSLNFVTSDEESMPCRAVSPTATRKLRLIETRTFFQSVRQITLRRVASQTSIYLLTFRRETTLEEWWQKFTSFIGTFALIKLN